MSLGALLLKPADAGPKPTGHGCWIEPWQGRGHPRPWRKASGQTRPHRTGPERELGYMPLTMPDERFAPLDAKELAGWT